MKLIQEFNYYLKHQKELVSKYNGKFIVIMNNEVIGVYETEKDAYENSISEHKVGTFLIQKCESGENSYTQTYNSRVVFS